MNQAEHRAFKDRLYEQFARIGRALASPKRLEIVDLLAQGERSVDDLAEQAGMSIANASQHLQTLKGAQLVVARREGPYAYYRLAGDAVFAVWRAVREAGEANLAEIDRLVGTFVHDRGQLEALGADELLGRMHDRGVTVLDVRPESEYRAGHIPGALSTPIDALESALRSLPRDAEVVAYCRGPYCLFSDEAVALLRERGFRARRLREGLPDWRAAGHPVEQGPSRGDRLDPPTVGGTILEPGGEE